VPIIYAQYLYWYWYLKVKYWYLYWYLDYWYWYWYWYLFVEYLIQDWKPENVVAVITLISNVKLSKQLILPSVLRRCWFNDLFTSR